MRLGFLFPPYGGEDELYVHGEALGDDVRVILVGTRIFGGDNEHAPEHLRETGSLDHLEKHARVIGRTHPDVVIWACTSGSFIDGAEHARQQAERIGRVAGCPASSTSLAFVCALRHLAVKRVAVLASYPQLTANAFVAFLGEFSLEVSDMTWLAADSGPAAASLGDERLIQEARRLSVPSDGALLIPDTALPSMRVIETLEDQLGCAVLTANQVSLWEAVRLTGETAARPGVGRLFAS